MRRSLIPDLALLQTFECAARHGNFSRAAEELNLTQSAVSRQIRDLEARSDLVLFERIRKRVVLSSAGLALLPEVRHLLAEAERLMIGTLAAEPGVEPLRIGTLPTFGARWLVPRLGDFMRLHPDILPMLETRDRPFSFVEESLDLTIHYGQPVWPGAVASFLCSEAVVPVASRDLAARLMTNGGVDLTNATLLHMTARPRLWTQWFDHCGQTEARAWRGPRFDQFTMIISAVSAGLGVGLVPSYLIEQETASGELVVLSDRPMPTDNAYYVVIPEGRQAHRATRLFHDWILGQVRRTPLPGTPG
ncbi:LysR family transcriptional regulator [Gemmobacter serpentinus]|uniref:LysR family transcriptional regulator n=1 Tax=Gemmobacter serpentinus TaxID=2652247 RepID=UPI001CF628F3|nr:LysR family transcriptional regulator [Gemmobacter serpentinus]